MYLTVSFFTGLRNNRPVHILFPKLLQLLPYNRIFRTLSIRIGIKQMLGCGGVLQCKFDVVSGTQDITFKL